MRLAARSLGRRPLFSLAAILTVALGVGTNVALFSVVYAVLLRPLPFPDPGRLAQLWETHPALPHLQVAAPDYRDWREQVHSFEGLAAYTLSAMNTVTLLGQGEPAIVHATMASSNLFPLVGIRPSAGRAFTGAEDAGRQHVALVSEKLWRQKWAADPALIGRQVRLEKETFRVIGVVPQAQAIPEWADLWIPLSLMESELQTRRKYHPLEVIGRLKTGVTVEQAQSEIQTVARRLARAYPDTNANIGASAIALARERTEGVRPSLLLAWAAVGLVLLIACANLSHLFLARASERQEELAIRRALGAGSWQLIRQLLAESFLILATGGAAGLVFAAWAERMLGRLSPLPLPGLSAGYAGPVWLFAIGIALIAGLLFGLPACWQVMDGQTARPETGRSVTRGRRRLSAVLLSGEVAIALLVLSGTVLLARNFVALLREDAGFQARQVVAVDRLPLRKDFEQSEEFFRTRLGPLLRRAPGVAEVAAVNSAPMSLGPAEHSRFATRFGIEGRTFESGSYPVAQNRWMTPEYLPLLGVPLRRGRWLTETDRDKPRIVVNETLARRFFPRGDAVGKRLVLGVMDSSQTLDEIVGVVGDIRDFGLDQEVEPTIYGIECGPVMTVVVKIAGNRSDAAAGIRSAIHAADPDIPVTRIEPLQQNVSDSLARRRFVLVLLAAFAGLAAFLTAGGIYGLLTQSVNTRVREFGVRAAVGARPGELVWMIVREAVTLSLPGLLAGGILSLAFARVMKSFVYQASPADPLSIGIAAVFLLALVCGSAWLPGRRAAQTDPALALKQQ